MNWLEPWCAVRELHRRWWRYFIVSVVCAAGWSAASAQPSPAPAHASPVYRFEFGTAKPGRAAIQVLPTTSYSPAIGYALAAGESARAFAHSICSDSPFWMSVDVPEGNYDVTVQLGGEQASLTTVKAEARRLLIEELRLPAGHSEKRRFTVNVRYPELRDGRRVRLKNDEQGDDLDWDHRLTLEFSNSHPCVTSLEVRRNDRATTVYLAGDSTVTDQRREPWAAWGQMLPRFFTEGVAIANHAESGESLKSFIGENRLAKILETIKPGDYLFIQFAHNDQKPGASHVEALTTYKDYLRQYIDEARKQGATPVLVTSMHRRKFSSEGIIENTLGQYPDAMRQLAAEQNVPLIDLNTMSKSLFEALGPEGTLRAFVHYPAQTFAGQERELNDDTHFNSYGAYELARCIAEGTRAARLGLARHIVPDTGHFDPARPDPVEAWKLPSAIRLPGGKTNAGATARNPNL